MESRQPSAVSYQQTRTRRRSAEHRSLRPAPQRLAQACGGFTLIELLVVIAIIAILTGVLLPAIAAVKKAAKIAFATSTIANLDIALSMYKKDWGSYPPDKFDNGCATDTGACLGTPGSNYIPDPGEALWATLCNKFRGYGPYFEAAEGYVVDFDNDGLKTITDPWGNPYVYNRGPFPTLTNNFPFASARPMGRPDSYDLYSLGPDMQTSNGTARAISYPGDIQGPTRQQDFNDSKSNNPSTGDIQSGSDNIPDFYNKACCYTPLTNPTARYGEAEDDIRNWAKPR